MGLRYSGPGGNYPVYQCTADRRQHGGPRCQEIRALPIDTAVESLALAALAPDRLALAVAWGAFEEEARLLERQSSLRRERAHYAVEPENRLVARSLERAWEERLREVEQIEAEYQSWRREQPVSLSAADRAQIISLGEDLPQLWNATTTTAAERKEILRLLIKRAFDPSRGAGLYRLCRPRSSRGAPSRARRRPKNGWRDRRYSQCRRPSVGARAPVQRRRDPPVAQALGHCDSENQ
jgi:hypothetical protein